jgi:hypothetical protein
MTSSGAQLDEGLGPNGLDGADRVVGFEKEFGPEAIRERREEGPRQPRRGGFV